MNFMVKVIIVSIVVALAATFVQKQFFDESNPAVAGGATAGIVAVMLVNRRGKKKG